MLIMLWLLFSAFIAVIASSRGRSAFGFFLLSAILSPLIGLIVVMCLPRVEQKIEAEKIASGELRKCPTCAEVIKAEAIKCRFCGAELPALSKPDPFIGS